MTAKLQTSDDTNLSDFLISAGWGGADIQPKGADMGLRRYFFVTKDDKSALLMDMSRAGILETGLEAFLKVGEFLRAHNINAPEIYYSDISTGLALIENFGDISFGDTLKKGVDKKQIYKNATKVICEVRNSAKENNLNLPGYKDTLIWERVPQFVDYYMPAASDTSPSDHIHGKYQEMWREIENNLPNCQKTMCLADYHLENLMWREGQTPDYGVIDFQDAFWAECPYDLVNLLEDARATVPEDIKQEMKDLYCADMNQEERKSFDDWYVVMSAHFHCRVIGLFIKFAQDGRGEQFLPHIPRLQNYLKTEIENPVLAPLKAFIEEHNISLDCKPKL